MSGIRWVVMLAFCWITGMGCAGKDGVPRGIIPRDRMEQVMWDMAQADQYVALYLAKDSAHIDRKKETLKLYETVFRLYDVSLEQFRKSYRYYLDHPELGQLLFDSVIARGVRARTEMYDRPFQVHPPVTTAMPGAGAVPGVHGPGVVTPGRPGVVMPGRPGGVAPGVMPGKALPSGSGLDAMQRMRELARRRQDSIARVKHLGRDTMRGKP
jgi:Domain of unknown function (DUF4296)